MWGGGDVVGWLVGLRGEQEGGWGGGAKSSLDRHGKGEGQLNSRKGRGGGGGGDCVHVVSLQSACCVSMCPCMYIAALQLHLYSLMRGVL